MNRKTEPPGARMMVPCSVSHRYTMAIWWRGDAWGVHVGNQLYAFSDSEDLFDPGEVWSVYDYRERDFVQSQGAHASHTECADPVSSTTTTSTTSTTTEEPTTTTATTEEPEKNTTEQP